MTRRLLQGFLAIVPRPLRTHTPVDRLTAGGVTGPRHHIGEGAYHLSKKIITFAEWHQENDRRITIIARCSAKPEEIEGLKGLATDLVQASGAEAGNVSYDFYEDLTDPAKFTFIEVRKDQAATDSHNATPHFQGFVKSAGPFFAGPVDVALYRIPS